MAKPPGTVVNSRPYHGTDTLLTKEEQVWWRGNYPHPVRILLWRLASEREKLAQIKNQLEKRVKHG